MTDENSESKRVDNIYMLSGIWNWFSSHVFGEGVRRIEFSSKFWQLSKRPGCHDETSKNNKDEQTTHTEDTEAHKACYHPNLWVLISDISLIHSSFSLSFLVLVWLADCVSIVLLTGHQGQSNQGVHWCEAPPCGQAIFQDFIPQLDMILLYLLEN